MGGNHLRIPLETNLEIWRELQLSGVLGPRYKAPAIPKVSTPTSEVLP